MPQPGPAAGQDQTLALFIAAAGVALLVLALAGEGLSRLRDARARRARSALVDALLLTAGLALLLVQRLDQAALSRVLATIPAAVSAAAMAERERRWRTTPGQVNSLRGHPVRNFSANCSPHGLSKELS